MSKRGNRLMAEFMGAKLETGELRGWYSGIMFPHGFNSCMNLQYDTSWEWLMSVVLKIEEGNYGFKICRKVVEIYEDDTKNVVVRIKEKSKFESLYYAVQEFVQQKDNLEDLDAEAKQNNRNLLNSGINSNFLGHSHELPEEVKNENCFCKVCGKPFKDSFDLYSHYDEEHNNMPFENCNKK